MAPLYCVYASPFALVRHLFRDLTVKIFALYWNTEGNSPSNSQFWFRACMSKLNHPGQLHNKPPRYVVHVSRRLSTGVLFHYWHFIAKYIFKYEWTLYLFVGGEAFILVPEDPSNININFPVNSTSNIPFRLLSLWCRSSHPPPPPSPAYRHNNIWFGSKPQLLFRLVTRRHVRWVLLSASYAAAFHRSTDVAAAAYSSLWFVVTCGSC